MAVILGDWLLSQGYRVDISDISEVADGFVCVVHDDSERWVAWGLAEGEALAEAIARMFPSRAARMLALQAAEQAASDAQEPIQAERVGPSEPAAAAQDPACERIQRGTYDRVLCATGFSDHSVDALLHRAARGAGVPYCRVGSGRPRTCVRALASHLGLAA